MQAIGGTDMTDCCTEQRLILTVRVVGVMVVVVVCEVLVLKHDLVDESAQPDARVGRDQMHQCEPHPHLAMSHLQLTTEPGQRLISISNDCQLLSAFKTLKINEFLNACG